MKNNKLKYSFASLILLCSILLTMCACAAKSNDTFSHTSETVRSPDTVSYINIDQNSNTVNSTVDSRSEYSLMYTVDNIDLKNAPEDSADVSASLVKDSPVLAKNVGNGWYEINMDNTLYYVRSQYLTSVYSQPDFSSNNSSKAVSESEGASYFSSEIINSLSDEETVDPNSTEQTDSEVKTERNVSTSGKVIVIDAGHQQQANLDTEPIGPGASEMKIKVSGGTSGVASGLAEYELTLALALKLQPILEERGYTVIQTRTTNEVDISNIERANVANSISADAFIRIHANGSDNPDTNGAMTLCQTPTNPYNGNLYEQSKALSTFVLDELVASTGCTKEYVWETDTMAGINWAQVPVTIVEVGYMSNPEEDLLMATDDYQNKICIGIANGIDKFF